MASSSSSSQWDRLLQNVGVWDGSFTRLSPEGDLKDDMPTQIVLESIEDGRTLRQINRYYSPDRKEITQEKIFEYSALGRGILFLSSGAFSLGSLQFAPFTDFGAELGFIRGDRRLRLVQLFNSSELNQITLIREQRQGTEAAERPTLTADQLVGDWQGEAETLYLDGRSPEQYPTQLSIRVEGDRLHQTLATPEFSLESTARIAGTRLYFENNRYPVQVLLLPDGASSNTPLTVPRGQPFFLEAGWLATPNLRYRMIRRYDERGAWVSLTLITERRTLA